MIDRGKVVIALLAILAVVSAIGFGLMMTRLGAGDCLSGSGDASSCPTLAEVKGVRYSVSVARGVLVDDSDVTPFAPITRTNGRDYFVEQMAYQVDGIGTDAVLVAPAANLLDEDDSQFRILWGPERAAAFPALCNYFSSSEQALLEECAGAGAS